MINLPDKLFYTARQLADLFGTRENGQPVMSAETIRSNSVGFPIGAALPPLPDGAIPARFVGGRRMYSIVDMLSLTPSQGFPHVSESNGYPPKETSDQNSRSTRIAAARRSIRQRHGSNR